MFDSIILVIFLKIFRTKNTKINFWLDVSLLIAVLAVVLYAFFWPIRVTGNSMSPSVNHGDHLALSRFLGRFGRLSSGDVVLVRIDGNSAVKRLAAAPGDHIRLESGMLYVNGTAALWALHGNCNKFIDKILGVDEFFLLGDNLEISTDSRHFGPISQRQIVAKILIRYFPLTDINFY